MISPELDHLSMLENTYRSKPDSEVRLATPVGISSLVASAVEAFRRGEMVLVMDAESRENECDIFQAGGFVTEASMAFMIRHSTGIVCAVADEQRLVGFGLSPAVTSNTDKNSTNFYVSTDFLPETTTGVSAADRAATINAFVNLRHPASTFSKPGHVFPLCARSQGLLEREGHTEAAYDLCRLAGLPTVAAIAELMGKDGRMLRRAESVEFAKKQGLILVGVSDLKDAVSAIFGQREPSTDPRTPTAYESTPSPSNDVRDCRLPCRYWSSDVVSDSSSPLHKRADEQVTETQKVNGELSVFRYPGNLEIVTLVRGSVRDQEKVPCRVHSECLTGDVLGSLRCDCGEQLKDFLACIGEQSSGVLVYVRGHEGRGMGLANKMRAYKLQDELHLDTVESNLHLGFYADTRDFQPVRDVLMNKLGIKSIILYTNNPLKSESLGDTPGQTDPLVAATQAIPSTPNAFNLGYLQTKQKRMRHATVLQSMDWGTAEGKGKRVSIVAARWHNDFLEPVLNACINQLEEKEANVRVVRVAGAFDLIAGARAVGQGNKTDAVICIGVLIKGESDSYDYTCQAISAGFAQLNATLGLPPVVLGVPMCRDVQQAENRCIEELGIGLAKEALELAQLA